MISYVHIVMQSYGGFVASHAVANETDIYPCGISGAALSDRRYYGMNAALKLQGQGGSDIVSAIRTSCPILLLITVNRYHIILCALR